MERVADVLVRLAAAAQGLAPALVALELNPLWCRGDALEGLDVLVETRGPREIDRFRGVERR